MFEVLSVAGLFGASLFLFIEFLVAYFNGYQVSLTINDYGEAHFELVMLIIVILCGLITLIRMLRR